MKTIKRQWMFVIASIAATSAGCGGGDEATGHLSLGVSDGPIHSAKKVCITFNEIELKGPGEGTTLITLDPPEKINLLEFQGANAMPILTNEELPAGRYNWMRLGIDAVMGSNGGLGDDPVSTGCQGDASYIVMDDDIGTMHNLYVPSGAETGLKLVGGYTVPVNDTVSLTAEFDVGRSITAPPGLDPDVVLSPTIKLVDNNEVGTLTGQVANELAEAEACEPSVYVFNDGVTPNGIEDGVDDPEDPIATAIVASQDQPDETVQWHYTVGFLLTGEYEVAFTCDDGETFEPADGKPASIAVGETTTVDFEAPAL